VWPGSVAADIRLVRVRHAIGGLIVAAALALPAGAAAAPGGQVSSLAAQQCSQERANIGKKAFRKRYGRKGAMRACTRRHRGQVAAAVGPAAKDCQGDLADFGAADFIDIYADEPTDSLDYAMSECIAEGVNDLLNPDDDSSDDGDDEE
jgi:hypothetical protein